MMIARNKRQTRRFERSTYKRHVEETRPKRYRKWGVTLPDVKSAAKRYNEALGAWLALADAALAGNKTTPGQGISIADVSAKAVVETLRARRESFPSSARAIALQLDFTAARKLGHQVAQILHALAVRASALSKLPIATIHRDGGPVPIAATHRDGGKVNIHVTRGRITVLGFEAVDSFLSTIEGVEAWRIRHCELTECSRLFWATRRDSRCCCKQHAAVCRIRRYRARREEYERRRELKRGREEYERRRGQAKQHCQFAAAQNGMTVPPAIRRSK